MSGILTTPGDFKSRHVYISNFTIRQNDIFGALLKATKTTGEDWTITRRTTNDLKKDGLDRIGNGNFAGALDLIFTAVFKAGIESDLSATHKLDNEVVALRKANLVEITKAVMERK